MDASDRGAAGPDRRQEPRMAELLETIQRAPIAGALFSGTGSKKRSGRNAAADKGDLGKIGQRHVLCVWVQSSKGAPLQR
jgi:hypothetical protein